MTIIRRIFSHKPSSPEKQAAKEVDRLADTLLTRGKIDKNKVHNHVNSLLKDGILLKSPGPVSGKGTNSYSNSYLALQKVYFQHPKEVGEIVYEILERSKGATPPELSTIARHYEESAWMISPKIILKRLNGHTSQTAHDFAFNKLRDALIYDTPATRIAATNTFFALLDYNDKNIARNITNYLDRMISDRNEKDFIRPFHILGEKAITVLEEWGDSDKSHLPHSIIARLALEKCKNSSPTQGNRTKQIRNLAHSILEKHEKSGQKRPDQGPTLLVETTERLKRNGQSLQQWFLAASNEIAKTESKKTQKEQPKITKPVVHPILKPKRNNIIALVQDMCQNKSEYFDELTRRPLQNSRFKELKRAFKADPDLVGEAISSVVRDQKSYRSLNPWLLKMASHYETKNNILLPYSALYTIYQHAEKPVDKQISILRLQIMKLDNDYNKNVETMKDLRNSGEPFDETILKTNTKIQQQIVDLTAQISTLKFESEEKVEEASRHVVNKLEAALKSSDPKVAQQAANTMMALLQSDVPILHEILSQRIAPILDAHHDINGGAPLNKELDERAKLIDMLAEGAKTALRSWQGITTYKEDPHLLTALIVLMTSKRIGNPDPLTVSAREIFARYQRTTAIKTPPTVTEQDLDPKSMQKNARMQAFLKWSNCFPPTKPLTLGQTFDLVASKAPNKREYGLTALCSHLAKRPDVERRAYERVSFELKKQNTPFNEISPVLALLARRHKDAPQEFKDNYDKFVSQNETYNKIYYTNSFTNFNRLLAISELFQGGKNRHNDVMFTTTHYGRDSKPTDINYALKQFRLSEAKYLVMPMHNGYHYVSVVVTKSGGQQSVPEDVYEHYRQGMRSDVRLHASVLQTLAGDNTELKNTLAQIEVDSCTLHSGPLQFGSGSNEFADLGNMTNGCGVFSIMIHDHLRDTLEKRDQDGAPLDSDQIVKDFVKDFTALEPEDKRQIHLFKRLQMFDRYVHAPDTER